MMRNSKNHSADVCILSILAVSLVGIIVTCLLAITTIPSPAYARQANATETPIPTRQLIFNQTIHGSIALSSGIIAYRFVLPHDRDVVVALKADKEVFSMACYDYKLSAPSMGAGHDCGDPVYSEQDVPVANLFFLPADSVPNQQTTYAIQLSRGFESSTTFTLTAYATPPKPITFDKAINGTGALNNPFAVYTFAGASTDFVTAILQERQSGGSYLWVNRLFTNSDSYTQARHIDGFHQDVGTKGLSDLQLLYVPATKTYHLLTGAIGSYLLNILRNTVDPLQAANQPATLAFDNPIHIFRVSEIQNNPNVKIRVNSVVGSGVRISAIQDDAEFKVFDIYPQNLPQTLEFTAPNSNPLYIVAQIGSDTDRTPVTLDMALLQSSP